MQPLNNLHSSTSECVRYGPCLPTEKLQIRTNKTEITAELPPVKCRESSQYLQSSSKDLRDSHALCALQPWILSGYNSQSVAFLHVKAQVSEIVFDLSSLMLFREKPQ